MFTKTKRRNVLKKLTLGMAALAMTAGLSSASQASDTITWRMQANLNAGEPGYIAVQTRFADLIETMSAGRMKIKLFPVGALFPVKEGLEGVGNGITEMALLTGGYFSGKLGPIANLESGLPGSLNTPLERYNFFFTAGFIDLAREAYAKYGVYYLAPQLAPGFDIISKTPITSMADFKGLKIRAYGIEAEWFKAMGASPTYLGGGEIYTGLATGVVNAARWGSPAAHKINSYHEVAKYYLKQSTLAAPNNFFAVNQGAWDKLPKDLQAIVREASTAASLDYIARSMSEDAKALKEMQAAGVTVTTIDPVEWAKMEEIVKGLWAKYSEKDDLSKRGVALLKSYLAELGR